MYILYFFLSYSPPVLFPLPLAPFFFPTSSPSTFKTIPLWRKIILPPLIANSFSRWDGTSCALQHPVDASYVSFMQIVKVAVGSWVQWPSQVQRQQFTTFLISGVLVGSREHLMWSRLAQHSLCRSGWLQTHDSPASATWVLNPYSLLSLSFKVNLNRWIGDFPSLLWAQCKLSQIRCERKLVTETGVD